MYACIHGIGSGFPPGCAPPAMHPPIFATHPASRFANCLMRSAPALFRQSGFLWDREYWVSRRFLLSDAGERTPYKRSATIPCGCTPE